MKRIILLILVLSLVLILSGCTKFVCPNGDVVFQPDMCPKDEDRQQEKAVMQPKPEPAAEKDKLKEEQQEQQKETDKQEPEKAIIRSSEWQKLDEKFEESSYKFAPQSARIYAKLKKRLKDIDAYTYYDINTKLGTFYVKGGMIRIQLAKRIAPRGSPVDFVVINTANKTAYGYCKFGTICNKEIAQIAWELDYGKYKPITPAERLLSTVKDPVLVGDKMCASDSRCFIMKFKTEYGGGEAWVNDFNGLPYYINDGEKEYKYKDISVAMLEDKDVSLPHYISEYR